MVLPAHFALTLQSDMLTQSVDWLADHYPELTFERVGGPVGGQPEGEDFAVAVGTGGWTVARWRECPAK